MALRSFRFGRFWHLACQDRRDVSTDRDVDSGVVVPSVRLGYFYVGKVTIGHIPGTGLLARVTPIGSA